MAGRNATADAAPVTGATVSDLDADAVQALLRRLRERQPKTFGPLDDELALRRLRALTDTPAGRVPTLAGLLALGRRPRDFRPDLGLTLVVYPGLSANDRSAGDPTSRSFDGPVPALVAAATAAVAECIPRKAARDGVDLPAAALREVIINALLHRDYTPGYTSATQDRQVVIAVYARQLTVISPGGLVAPITEADLTDEAGHQGRVPVATRNPLLARLLAQVDLPGADRTVTTNRGTGIPTVARELLARGLNRPEFHHHPGWFTVILRRPRPPMKPRGPDPSDLIRAALAAGEPVGRWTIEESTGLSRGTVMNHLNYLIGNGEVEAVGTLKSRQRTYRLTDRPRRAR